MNTFYIDRATKPTEQFFRCYQCRFLGLKNLTYTGYRFTKRHLNLNVGGTNTVGRKILAVVIGWIVAVAVILIGQMLMATMWSPPPTAIKGDPEILRQYVADLPTSAFVSLIVIYGLAAFAGGFIATKMGRQVSSGITLALVIGTLLFLGGVVNFFFILPYHPMWVTLVSLLLYFPAALLGYRLAR
jgi:hypothetical protein